MAEEEFVVAVVGMVEVAIMAMGVIRREENGSTHGCSLLPDLGD